MYTSVTDERTQLLICCRLLENGCSIDKLIPLMESVAANWYVLVSLFSISYSLSAYSVNLSLLMLIPCQKLTDLNTSYKGVLWQDFSASIKEPRSLSYELLECIV